MARRGKGKKEKSNDMAGLMGMMGIPGMPGMTGDMGMGDIDIDDAELEAELLKLEGKKPPVKSKSAKVRTNY